MTSFIVAFFSTDKFPYISQFFPIRILPFMYAQYLLFGISPLMDKLLTTFIFVTCHWVVTIKSYILLTRDVFNLNSSISINPNKF